MSLISGRKIASRTAAMLVAGALAVAGGTAHAWTLERNMDNVSNGAFAGEGFFNPVKASAEVAYSGNHSAKLPVSAGTDGWGSFGGVFMFPQALQRGQEAWFRVRVYWPSGFDYTAPGAGGRLKFLRLHTATSGGSNIGYDDIYINSPGSSPQFQYIYETVDQWVPLGGSAEQIKFNTWETYEFYVKFDTVPVSQGGQGRVRFWKNGNLVRDISDKVTLSQSTGKIDSALLFTYWNGNAPRTQSLYVDDIVVTSDTPSARDAQGNAYIGMGAGGGPSVPNPTRPNPPSGVGVN
jgi:hypothetical protein